MQFPKWVNKRGMTREDKASARLNFILYTLALSAGAPPSIRTVCDHVDLNHSTISLYIKRGAFSQSSAEKIEKAFGGDTVQASWLTDPLAIPSDK